MSKGSNAIVSFIIGAAVGVAVGYLCNTEKRDELVEKLKDETDKLKRKFKNKKQEVADAIDNELAKHQ
jgi:gas vesicle protein